MISPETGVEPLTLYERDQLQKYDWCELLSEAQTLDDSVVRPMGGAALELFSGINRESVAKLHEISTELPPGVLAPQNYWSKEQRGVIYRVVSERFRSRRHYLSQEHDAVERMKMDITKIGAGRRADLAVAAETLVKERTPIKRGMDFARSPYVSMEGEARACNLACALMAYAGITGEPVRISPVKSAAKRLGFVFDDMSDLDVMKIFMTDTFKELANGKEARVISLAGFTENDLEGVVKRLQAAKGVETRLILSVTSKSPVASPGTWHQIVVSYLNAHSALVHDPANYGGPDQVLDTEPLLKRWYETQGTGYLVVTQSV